MNKLYYGDNLTIMQNMPMHFVDLVYLDPPFNSKKDYNLLYKTLTGKPVPEQAEAFCDTWEMDPHKEEVAKSMPGLMREYGVDDYYVRFWQLWMMALKNTQPHLLAYLIYMVERLLHMKKILKRTGSIYLHCDPTASHYIKIMMDGIFGHKNFRSEIVWRRTNSHNKLSRQYGPIHDIILFYSVSDKFYFQPGYTPYTKAYIDVRFTGFDSNGRYQLNYLTGPGVRHGESGTEWQGFNPTNNGRHWAIPKSLRGFLPKDRRCATLECLDLLHKQELIVIPKNDGQPMYKQYVGPGVPYQDIWAYQPNTKGVLVDSELCIDEDVKYLENDDERLGYPTQKPIGLLKRMITTSTRPGDLVFDPFCGCGTTVYAAVETQREWMGCDIAILSVRLIQDRLVSKYRLTENVHFQVDGIPVSVEQAEELFRSDRFQFQHWLVERVGGFPSHKKSGDLGIDGRVFLETIRGFKEVILSVKGGKVQPRDVRDLRGVLEREQNAVLSALLTLQEPSAAMKREAAEAGMYEYGGRKYDRIQFLTVRQILEEKRQLDSPTTVKSKVKTAQQSLILEP